MDKKGLKVILIGASSICGRVGPNLTGSSIDRAFLESMREETDASLLGAETLRHDDPEMRGKDGHLAKDRLRCIISGSANIPISGKKLFNNGPRPILFTSHEQQDALQQKAGDKATVIALPTGPAGLSLVAAIAELSKLGARSLLIEGGGRLNYAALKEGVVDEICLTITPKLSGDKDGALFCNGSGPLGNPYSDITLLSSESRESDEVFLRYQVQANNSIR